MSTAMTSLRSAASGVTHQAGGCSRGSSCYPGLRLLMRFKWSGKENIPKTGGIILAPNHLSYADWPAIALFSDGYAHRYPVFMIKSGIFEVKVVGSLMYKFGQLPVYRGRGDAGLVLKQAERALRKGDA